MIRPVTGLCIRLALLATALATALAVNAEEPECLDCHTASSDTAVHAIFRTAHGQLEGGGDASCETCHGSSVDHRASPTQQAPQISFGPQWPSSADTRNQTCLGCHEKDQQLLWMGSGHEQDGLACDSCHTSHTRDDPALDDDAAQAQCTTCHTDTRAELHLPSRHPIAEGKTACSDCHNPHGGMDTGDLHQTSLNDNCLSCHQEKRGPFLWEHAPVAEDCSLCHRPHGSVNPALLTTRGPALCQQCHAAAFHPSVPYGAEGLSGGTANANVLGKNCLNCHSQVHGSNHPSGARLTR